MKVKEFKDDDEGFKRWRENNPKGFILNLPRTSKKSTRKFYPGAVKLHSAACPTLQEDKNGEKQWTEKGYFKVCAIDAKDLIKWFEANAEEPASWEPPRCKHCMPHE